MQVKPFKFIVLYGLPGAGKTTLASALSSDTVHYIQLDAHPQFGKKSIIDIIETQFVSDKHVITEGCFPSSRYRAALSDIIPNTHVPMYIYVQEDISELCSRRKGRSAEEYRDLLDDMQIIDDPPHHMILRAKDADTRLAILEDLLTVNLVDYTLP
jgi:adenylate kinase family enzyme